ncbi:MAG TPA: type II secretion system protein [Planctomycetota bacterium]|nr:type II secretion system protein [Planctomycetota bacterium]
MMITLSSDRFSGRHAGLRAARRGFSMLELMVVMAVLTMAVGMFSSTLISTTRHSRMKRELAIASEGARNAMELMRSQACSTLFATYNTIAGDDPGGPGTAPGQNFVVPGLEPRVGDADGCVGRILFPTIGGQLREDVVDLNLGMPRDLDGDVTVDGLSHNGDYILLPVRVRIEWKGVSGDVAFDLYNQFVKS